MTLSTSVSQLIFCIKKTSIVNKVIFKTYLSIVNNFVMLISVYLL